MELYKLISNDGDMAVFYRNVLISYYDSVVDEVKVKMLVEAVADNIARAVNNEIKTARFEKEPDFVHWESSHQVADILNAGKLKVLSTSDRKISSSLVDEIAILTG